MDERWFQLVLAIIPVLGTVITAFIIPWIKTKIDNEKLSKYMTWARCAVRYAEQMYTKEQWKAKKDYCVEYLSDMFGGALSMEQIEVIIEAAVNELKLAEKGVA